VIEGSGGKRTGEKEDGAMDGRGKGRHKGGRGLDKAVTVNSKYAVYKWTGQTRQDKAGRVGQAALVGGVPNYLSMKHAIVSRAGHAMISVMVMGIAPRMIV
jgi:hypothetical protein